MLVVSVTIRRGSPMRWSAPCGAVVGGRRSEAWWDAYWGIHRRTPVIPLRTTQSVTHSVCHTTQCAEGVYSKSCQRGMPHRAVCKSCQRGMPHYAVCRPLRTSPPREWIAVPIYCQGRQCGHSGQNGMRHRRVYHHYYFVVRYGGTKSYHVSRF